jgi:hypothetical protein
MNPSRPWPAGVRFCHFSRVTRGSAADPELREEQHRPRTARAIIARRTTALPLSGDRPNQDNLRPAPRLPPEGKSDVDGPQHALALRA